MKKLIYFFAGVVLSLAASAMASTTNLSQMECGLYSDQTILRLVNNTLRHSQQEYKWYNSLLVLVESGLKVMDGEPEYIGQKGWREWGVGEGVTLPAGYRLYSAHISHANNPFYLHFVGEVCEEDYCGVEVDQWYGPF